MVIVTYGLVAEPVAWQIVVLPGLACGVALGDPVWGGAGAAAGAGWAGLAAGAGWACPWPCPCAEASSLGPWAGAGAAAAAGAAGAAGAAAGARGWGGWAGGLRGAGARAGVAGAPSPPGSLGAAA